MREEFVEPLSNQKLSPENGPQIQFGVTDSSGELIRKQIIELYLNVKIRSQDEIQKMTEDVVYDERKKLNAVDTLDIIDYIKQSVEILMHMKGEEHDLFQKNWQAQEKLRVAELQRQKDELKKGIAKKKPAKENRLFERVRHELAS